MFSQKNIYQLAVTGALLLAGCTSDDVAFEAAPAGSVPLSFTCTSDDGFSDDGQEGTRAVIGYQGPMDSEDLRYTGFGVFASQSDGLPDMMYNQEVKFTYSGDKTDPLKGYWSYQPTKYWPSDLTHFYIGAYAPYQDPVAVDSDEPGIIGISGKSEAPYIKFRRSLKPEDFVDLLWYFGKPSAVPEAGTLAMKMGHALARLEVSVELESPPPAGTKVLIENIQIIGLMAGEGYLSMDNQIEDEGGEKYYPEWKSQHYYNHTFNIDNDESNNDIIFIVENNEYRVNYGIVDANVRYVKGLPFKWQPTGLSATPKNVLSTLDRKAYIYMIPKAEDEPPMDLTVNVKVHKMTDAGADDTYNTGSQTAGITLGNPLRGNTRYKLTIKLKNI